MRLFLAILVGKIIAFISQTLKIGGGSAAPGLYALKVYPELVEELAGKIPKNVVITGTNGKTTTARMLAHLAKESGLKVIRNSTGSNLERGVASALIHAFHIESVKLVTHVDTSEVSSTSSVLGIWELDEATFNFVTPKLKPDIVVFLNVFRDQLDRYGEVDTVVKRWCQTLTTLTSQTIVLVNGDDANTAKLKNCFRGKVETFGVKDYKIVGESLEHITHPQRLAFEAENIQTKGLEGTEFKVTGNRLQVTVSLPIPGVYHIYDAVAAIAAASHLNLPIHRLADTLKNFSPAFGRVEKLPFGYIFLIKNPAGATQVLETVAPQIKPRDRLLIALNDNLADGTDVSWIWDAEFEKLSNSLGVIAKTPPRCYVSGSRSHDMAVRLKYAGFELKRIAVEPSLEKALREAKKGLKGHLYILPTYTALLECQKILAKQKIKQYYWRDNE